MSLRMRDAWERNLGQLRHEPTEKRLRATLGGHTVVDSTRALLVWEPRRVVPSFAVPVDDVQADYVLALESPDTSDRVILHPGIAFSVHSTPGTEYAVHAGGEVRRRAAFRPDDPDLAGYVVLDFTAFDVWYEEDEPLFSHPRDPYHRVDVRASSRHVRVEFDGELLAESARPVLVFETNLPTRFYLPLEDVRVDLRPSARRTACAYKGEASYWSFEGADDVAWTYQAPLSEMAPLTGLVAFFDELVDVVLDGQLRERPSSPVAKSIVEEARS